MSGEGPQQLFQYRVELEANKLKEEAESLPQGGKRESLLDRGTQDEHGLGHRRAMGIVAGT